MNKLQTISFLLLICIASLARPELQVQPTEEKIRLAVIDWLKENTAFISCDDEHFIYGVGYIDGSYMERIFYVQGGGEKPILSVRLRGEVPQPLETGGDVGPISFVLEMKSPKVLYATPANGSWQVTEDGWETALRFKYTSWFGEARRVDGTWSANWQGYRRPMLPKNVTGSVEETCALFADR